MRAFFEFRRARLSVFSWRVVKGPHLSGFSSSMRTAVSMTDMGSLSSWMRNSTLISRKNPTSMDASLRLLFTIGSSVMTKETKTFDALDWLAQLVSHIPTKGEQMVRYGVYPPLVWCTGVRSGARDSQIPSYEHDLYCDPDYPIEIYAS